MVSLIKLTEDQGQIRLGLPSDLDLPMAQPLVDSLRHAFARSDSVAVQAEAVERISTACVQALVVATRHATDHNARFAITRPSEVLTEACDDLGLTSWLKQWSQT
jgi:anti-anti-sigma regulatory factor